MSKNREILLGEALCKVLKKVGVLRGDAEPTGAELLLATEDYLVWVEKNNTDA